MAEINTVVPFFVFICPLDSSKESSNITVTSLELTYQLLKLARPRPMAGFPVAAEWQKKPSKCQICS